MPTRLAPEPDLLHVIDLAVISHTIGTTIDPIGLLADLLQLDGDDLAEWLDHYRDARDLDVPTAVPPFHHTAAIPADITPDQPVDQHSAQLAALQRVIVAARWWERRGEVAMPVQEVLTLADADNLQPGDQWAGGITTTTDDTASPFPQHAWDETGWRREPYNPAERTYTCANCGSRIRVIGDGQPRGGQCTPAESWHHTATGETINSITPDTIPGAGAADRSSVSRARVRDAERAVWRQAEAGTVQHLVLHGRALCAATDAGPWRAVPVTNPCPGCVELERALVDEARRG